MIIGIIILEASSPHLRHTVNVTVVSSRKKSILDATVSPGNKISISICIHSPQKWNVMKYFCLRKWWPPSGKSYVWLRGYVHYLRVRNLKTSKVVKVNNLWKSQQMEQGIGPPCDDWMTLFRMEITITKKIISSHKISYRCDEIALPYSVLMFYI